MEEIWVSQEAKKAVQWKYLTGKFQHFCSMISGLNMITWETKILLNFFSLENAFEDK